MDKTLREVYIFGLLSMENNVKRWAPFDTTPHETHSQKTKQKIILR